MDWDRPTQRLQQAWDLEGFLGRLRQGQLIPTLGEDFVRQLRELPSSQADRPTPPRVVALLWYVPIFIVWQRERVAEQSGDLTILDRLANEIQAELERILGVP